VQQQPLSWLLQLLLLLLLPLLHWLLLHSVPSALLHHCKTGSRRSPSGLLSAMRLHCGCNAFEEQCLTALYLV
jgi:hypothetical protein